jgi:subfamily B ATP-binding cassette protein MsbA
MSDPPTTPRRGLRALLPLLRLYPWGIAAFVVLGVLASLAEGLGLSLFIPLLQGLAPAGEDGASSESWWAAALGDVFDGVPPDRRLLVICACIFASIALKAALAYANVYVFSRLYNRISHRLRSGVFDQYLRVSYRFIERSRAGELLNTLATETWRASDAVGLLLSLIVSACSVLVYVALLLILSTPTTLVVGGVMLGISLAVRGITARARGLGDEATRANAVLADRMVEGLSGMAVIRAFNRERHEQDRFDADSRRVGRAFMRLSLLSGTVGPVYEVLSAALLVSVIYVTLQDPTNLPSLLVFIFVLYRLQPRIMAVDSARTDLRALTAAVEDVMGMLDRRDKPYLAPGRAPHRGLRDAIRFERASFHYEPDEPPALDDVTLSIPAGRTTALVGPSGAGKSTLVKLLFRFYDPTEGVISVDGRPLAELELGAWRDRIALVSQDVFLFNGTVRENIAYGRPGATDAEIEEAARKADAHGFIRRLPQGYDTELGDRGVRLSGGQQQRITLARAIVRDPDLLILDEATNALDSRSERLIQDALNLFGEGRTVIIIAHRFSTIEQADHIVVLEGGRLCEEGDRESLLAHEGLFSELLALQRGAVL